MATAWEVETAVYKNYKNVSAQDPEPYGVFFKPDGLSMYVLGYSHDTVYQYLLSVAWAVEMASYTGKYKSVNAQETAPQGFSFSSNGAKMYVIGPSVGKIYQYLLSTLWDVDTTAYEDKFKYVGDIAITPRSMFFKPDGLKIYVIGTYQKKVYQFALSTPWEVETATYEDKFKYVGDQDTLPWGGTFSADGSRMYIMGYGNDTVYQYLLSTPYDVDTAVYEDKFKYVGDVDNAPRGLFFKPDGLEFYIAGDQYNKIFQYSLPPLAPPVGQPFALRRRGRIISLGGVR